MQELDLYHRELPIGHQVVFTMRPFRRQTQLVQQPFVLKLRLVELRGPGVQPLRRQLLMPIIVLVSRI